MSGGVPRGGRPAAGVDAAAAAVTWTMAAFDIALGTAAVAAPEPTLRLLGHRPPSADARALFRRCGPIWLTFAAAHVVAGARGAQRDWTALAWLRATELATDALWASSGSFPRTRSRALLRGAGAANAALSALFLIRARRARHDDPPLRSGAPAAAS